MEAFKEYVPKPRSSVMAGKITGIHQWEPGRNRALVKVKNNVSPLWAHTLIKPKRGDYLVLNERSEAVVVGFVCLRSVFTEKYQLKG